MVDEESNNLTASTPTETALAASSIIVALVPWIGGAVSEVLTGVSTARKMSRVNDVLQRMNERIKEHESDDAKQYVQTEDFRDLLEATLRQAASERSEDKRKCYGRFLARDINNPGELYDEKLRILRTMEELQEDHLRIVQAMSQPPDPTARGMSGSLADTLQKRIPDMPMQRIQDLSQQLTDLKVADLGSLNSMMTAHGAEELRSRFTPYGQNLLRYITDPHVGNTS